MLPTDDDPDTTPFAYTVGLTAHGYPELITAGLPPEIAHSLLNDLARRVYDRAERFTHGQRIRNLIAGYDAIIIDGLPTADLLPGMAIARYGRARVRLQQMVWPDRHHTEAGARTCSPHHPSAAEGYLRIGGVWGWAERTTPSPPPDFRIDLHRLVTSNGVAIVHLFPSKAPRVVTQAEEGQMNPA
ncbi:protein of unknown function (DUF4262) [Micromonospora matsumotoense]|uniref:Uncharacterized protein n=1 Tax=Micromonospora matsumotoense TaxID=121616 RepID=A0A1C5ABX2_9ACTN|nr:DUF4262 domain-containing protein [Micromonospora matsumotoense]SCF42720.1 protein of unknown function (DUF4262) [Micromonospora matsumotoense]